MMKTFLIIILTLALLAAAGFTRPAKREFVLYLLDTRGAFNNHAIDNAESLAKDVTFKNRILWTDVEKDGKVIYSGAFAHFFPRAGQAAELPLPDLKEVARLLQ
jgi:hypothetical protein